MTEKEPPRKCMNPDVERYILQQHHKPLRAYALLQFYDGVAVVSSKWMRVPNDELDDGNDVECFWPDQETASRVRKMAKFHAPVDKVKWTYHDAKLLYSADNWEIIMAKERMASDNSSCMDTDEERGTKRKSRLPLRYQDTSDEDEDEIANPVMAKAPPVPSFPAAEKMPRSTAKVLFSSTATSTSPTRNTKSTNQSSSRTLTSSSSRPKQPARNAMSTPGVTVSSSGPSILDSSPLSKGFEKTVIKMLTEMSLDINDIKKQVSSNASLLSEVNRGVRVGDSLPEDTLELDNLPVALPLKSVDDVQLLERELEDDDGLTKKLVLNLGILGGKNVTTTTRAILDRLMKPDVANQYNWTGAKGKKEFKKLKVVKVISRAVRRNPRTKDATNEDVKESIVNFLYNARDKDGGRKQRNLTEQQ